jgi:hypothetical protein
MRGALDKELRCLASLIELLASGGDARIALSPETGLNRYYSAPCPSDVVAYASSTANGISAAANAHLERVLDALGPTPSAADYAAGLATIRARIRAAYGVPDNVEIVLAPSGTDLEYVALACAAGRAPNGTHNILVGADEVGSGCIRSAHGLYYAGETALEIQTWPGAPVPGLGGETVSLVDIPVRDTRGQVRTSSEITGHIEREITNAAGAGRHPIVHVVHGSKTGLILPALNDVDALRADHGDEITLVVDACQARITGTAVNAYLARGAIVFVTGSKFMGGPPFSGIALVPAALAQRAPSLPEGLATVFRRGEWPAGWPGAAILPDSANPGLLLRLEASIFELERFQALPPATVERIILACHGAVRTGIIDTISAHRIAPYPPGERETADNHPVEMRTLSTLDLREMTPAGASFEDAQRWHEGLLRHKVRLGQPVKCVLLPDGRWGATLRIGLSMPQIVEIAALAPDAAERRFADDMARIAEALRSEAC